MELSLDNLLGLSGITAEAYTYFGGDLRIQLRLLAKGTFCPTCDRYTERLNQTRLVLARDLPAFGKPVYLQIPRRQFHCDGCRRYFTEHLKFFDWKRRYTQRYEEWVYWRVQYGSLEQICRDEQLSMDEVKGIINHVKAKQARQHPSQLNQCEVG